MTDELDPRLAHLRSCRKERTAFARIMRERGWTLVALSRESGVCLRAISRARETGRTSVETALKLQDAMGVPAWELFPPGETK